MNEENTKKKKLIKYAVTAIADIVLALVISYARYKSFTADVTGNHLLQGLSDGFFVVGFLNFGLGALLWISTTGTLDIITYGLKAAVWFLIPIKRDKGLGDFYEYKVRQKEKRKGVPFEIIWIGLALIVVSAVLAALV